MREIALHLLDIAENSVAAQARTVTLTVCEDLKADRLTASVQDDGKGMDAVTVAQLGNPFFTSRTTRKVGLGIPLFKAAAEACNGGMTITSRVGKGTRLEASFQHSHIDRMPLGDLAGTLLTLVVAYQDIRWVLDYSAVTANGRSERFVFDTEPIRKELYGLPLTEPDVLTFVRQYIEEGLGQAQSVIANEGRVGALRRIETR